MSVSTEGNNHALVIHMHHSSLTATRIIHHSLQPTSSSTAVTLFNNQTLLLSHLLKESTCTVTMHGTFLYQHTL